MEDCLFCKISEGLVPSKTVYEDELIYAFEDINPAAKTHVIVIPRDHISGLEEITEENAGIVAKIFVKIPEIAKKLGLEKGYRVITNVGEYGQQSVQHLHFHIIGGEQLKWELV